MLGVGGNVTDLSSALRDVRVTIPVAVRSGDNAILMCHYDLEQDSLYSIKWYKGRREFYRYTPRENPPMKVFESVSGIKVRVSMCWLYFKLHDLSTFKDILNECSHHLWRLLLWPHQSLSFFNFQE